jgi:hypothetical protein
MLGLGELLFDLSLVALTEPARRGGELSFSPLLLLLLELKSAAAGMEDIGAGVYIVLPGNCCCCGDGTCIMLKLPLAGGIMLPPMPPLLALGNEPGFILGMLDAGGGLAAPGYGIGGVRDVGLAAGGIAATAAPASSPKPRPAGA